MNEEDLFGGSDSEVLRGRFQDKRVGNNEDVTHFLRLDATHLY